ncbi:MAG: ATP-binding cassette domain-containing protein [Propionibacteriaceae bacterium]|nr:ATP-binding cassette domain-containing protein [Propionibacteriaceae bacterium]
MPDALCLEDVTVAHDGQPVVDDVSLGVRPGGLVALTGPSGSGKSTLLAVAGGLIPHGRAGELWGRVCHGGVDVTLDPPWARAAWLGFLAQDPASSLCLTHVRDELALPLENAGLPRDDIGPRVEAIAARLGITHLLDRRTNQLSGGEQQRVALAATLIGDPEVVLLDEPLSMLDPDAAADVAALLRRELGGEGPAGIIVEHRSHELERAGLVPDAVVRLGTPGPVEREESPGCPGAVVLDRELTGVRRDAEGPVVIDGVRVTLRAGTVTALLGPNGSGKSTLLMALAGVLPGQEPTDAVGLVFQRPENQFLASTVLAEASFGASVERGRALLERVGLADFADRNPHTLSLGQQRRLSVVAMAAQDHPVLLLDEPTFGLDDAGVAAVESLIRSLRDEGRAILLATHDVALAARLADARLELSGQDAAERPAPREKVPDSFLARCSPVLKFLAVFGASVGLLFTTAFWPVLAVWALATAAVPLLARVSLRRTLRFQIPIGWFALSTFLVNLFSRPGPELGGWGIFVATEPGLAWGLALAARTLAIGGLAAVFVLSTDAVRFVNAAHSQARVPVRYAYALLAGYRLLELLPDEWRTIRAAHAVRSRGLGGGRRAWLVGFARSAFGLMVVALRRGQQLAEALEARGLGRTPRTIWRPVRWGWRDAVFTGGVVLVAGAIVAVVLAG